LQIEGASSVDFTVERWTGRERDLQLQRGEVYFFDFMSWEIGKMGKLLMAPIFSIADLKRYFVSLASGNKL
jgi:hypothetical protein